jgi:hypothetical protein
MTRYLEPIGVHMRRVVLGYVLARPYFVVGLSGSLCFATWGAGAAMLNGVGSCGVSWDDLQTAEGRAPLHLPLLAVMLTLWVVISIVWCAYAAWVRRRGGAQGLTY